MCGKLEDADFEFKIFAEKTGTFPGILLLRGAGLPRHLAACLFVVRPQQALLPLGDGRALVAGVLLGALPLKHLFRHDKLDLLSHLREDPGAADEGHCLAEDELPRLMEEDGKLHEAALGSELVALVVVRARRELDAQVQGVHLAGLSGKLGRPV